MIYWKEEKIHGSKVPIILYIKLKKKKNEGEMPNIFKEEKKCLHKKKTQGKLKLFSTVDTLYHTSGNS